MEVAGSVPDEIKLAIGREVLKSDCVVAREARRRRVGLRNENAETRDIVVQVNYEGSSATGRVIWIVDV